MKNFAGFTESTCNNVTKWKNKQKIIGNGEEIYNFEYSFP